MAKNKASYLTPQKLEEFDSPINGRIEVVEFLGQPRIVVKGMLQSGGLIRKIWRLGLDRVEKMIVEPPGRVLILGLGGGTLAGLIEQTYPEAEMVGVELDPLVVSLARKYFKIEEIGNLEIIVKDGLSEVAKRAETAELEKFDLIVVDVYLGDQVPEGFETEEFLNQLSRLVERGGLVVFNRLFFKEHRPKTKSFVEKAERFFKRIELLRTPSNLLIFSQV